jgi:hypothetical protein
MSSEFEDTSGIWEEEIVKGKSIKIGDRTLCPVIEILTLERDGKFWFKSVTPFAIEVLEPDNRYIIPLWEDKEVDETSPKDDIEKSKTDGIRDELEIKNNND